jgi:ribonuclease Z
MSFKLTILGSSSAIPTIDRNPTAQLLNVNERFFLIDCGEGTQVQLRKYQLSFQRISHIFISHLHGDHYFGLIGLISSMHLLGRKKDLHIHAHKELKEIIDLQLSSSNTELNYPFFFHPIPEDSEGIILEDDNIKVSNIILDHSIKCSGFVFEEIRSKRKIIKSEVEKLNVPYDKMKSLKNGVDWINKKGEIISNEQLTIENSKPHTYAFCSDTRYNKQLISKIEGVDLLYHETTFKKDLEERAFQTGHSTTLQAASIAIKSNVKNLLIGHYSKRYRDFQELADESKEIFENVIVSYSGLEIDFKKLQ